MQAIESFKNEIWHSNLRELPAPRAQLIRAIRVVWVLVRDVLDGQVTLYAMSLVYTTLLSLVPLLAITFSLLKAFGSHYEIEPLLLQFLEPLGEQRYELTYRLTSFVENINGGVLGTLGIAFLLYTVLALIHKVEVACNHAWRVRAPRPLLTRFSGYLMILFVGPLLIFFALGTVSSLMNTEVVRQFAAMEPYASLYRITTRVSPYVLIIGGFTMIYLIVPHTRVKFLAALTGGVFAGLAWKLTGWMFGAFVAASGNYKTIYTSFAIMLIFMIWLYLSWLILLLGANLVFYKQYPGFVTRHKGAPTPSGKQKEALALLLMKLIAENFYNRRPAWTLQAIARHASMPILVAEKILNGLVEAKLLHRGDEDSAVYLPNQPLEITTVAQVIEVIRAHDGLSTTDSKPAPDIDRLIARAEGAADSALEGLTVKALAFGDADANNVEHISAARAADDDTVRKPKR